jgi:hypothetical protein
VRITPSSHQPPATCGRICTALSDPIGSNGASWSIWPSMATARSFLEWSVGTGRATASQAKSRADAAA